MTSKNEQNEDFVGSEGWDSIWKRVKKRNVTKLNYYHALLADFFARYVPAKARFVEIGCGGSMWLPYLAKTQQADVWGIDYSPEGIERSREADLRMGTQTKLLLADIFKPNDVPKDFFDALWSNGFIEHFTDPSEIVAIFKQHLRPGGVMITMVPNMSGFPGRLQRAVDRAVYENHQLITPAWMDEIHAKAGLTPVLKAQYSGIFSLGVVNYLSRFKSPIAYKIFMTMVSLIQQLVVLPFRLLGIKADSAYFSPYVIAVYKR